jgi:hypothetical protein
MGWLIFYGSYILVAENTIKDWWPVFVTLALWLVAFGGFRVKVATKKDLAAKEKELHLAIHSLDKEVIRRLYDENGSSIYMPRDACEKSQGACGTRILLRLEEMKIENQRRHDESRQEQLQHLALHSNLSEFVGTVRAFMDFAQGQFGKDKNHEK